MATYDTCVLNKKSVELLMMRYGIIGINIIKNANYLAILKLEIIIYPDVFYPITDFAYIYINIDGSFRTTLPFTPKGTKSLLTEELQKTIVDSICAL
jgi:hypothetical protein